MNVFGNSLKFTDVCAFTVDLSIPRLVSRTDLSMSFCGSFLEAKVTLLTLSKSNWQF